MRKALLNKGGIDSKLCKIALSAFMLFPATNIFSAAQLSAKVVKGTIVSATDNEPLIGATIKVDGKKAAAVTDLDGNFTIDAEDGETLLVSYIGFVEQKVKVAGSTLNISLKEEAATFSGAAGFKIANGGYRNWGNASKSNYTAKFMERWHGEGTSNTLPRLTTDDKNWTEFSDLYLQDGSYLRLANVTLGYDFSKLIGLKAISQARLYFQVQNLFTITGYDGMDPEVGYGDKAWMSGVDTGSYPHARTFIVGVNLKF